MASVMTKDEDVARLLLPIVNQACKDTVPNVRFIACCVAEKLVNHKADMRDTIKANVEPLLSDPDVDVRFFAIKALA
jgi:HEAT repeat protein